MVNYAKRAQEVVHKVMKEFEPAGTHAVAAGREMLLALRAAVDAEINLYDRATRPREGGQGGERQIPVEPEPLAQPGQPAEDPDPTDDLT